MPEYKNITFEVQVPQDVVLAFDSPKSGEKDGRKWIKYGCMGGVDFFSSEKLHDMLQKGGAKKGSKCRIVKMGDLGPWAVWVDGNKVGDADDFAPGNETPEPPKPATTTQEIKEQFTQPDSPVVAVPSDDAVVVIAARMDLARAMCLESEEAAVQNTLFIQLNMSKVQPPKAYMDYARSRLFPAAKTAEEPDAPPPYSDNDQPQGGGDLPF